MHRCFQSIFQNALKAYFSKLGHRLHSMLTQSSYLVKITVLAAACALAACPTIPTTSTWVPNHGLLQLHIIVWWALRGHVSGLTHYWEQSVAFPLEEALHLHPSAPPKFNVRWHVAACKNSSRYWVRLWFLSSMDLIHRMQGRVQRRKWFMVNREITCRQGTTVFTNWDHQLSCRE